MKIFNGVYCAHGEVNIFAIDEIPDGIAAAPVDSAGRPIIGHSETGALHVIEGSAIRVVEQDAFTSYVECREPAKVIHLRGFDTHEPLTLPPGKYRVSRQREYVPEGFRRAAD